MSLGLLLSYKASKRIFSAIRFLSQTKYFLYAATRTRETESMKNSPTKNRRDINGENQGSIKISNILEWTYSGLLIIYDVHSDRDISILLVMRKK